MHQRPDRTGHDALVIGGFQQFIALVGKPFFQQQHVQPIVALGEIGFVEETHAFNSFKRMAVFLRELAFCGEKAGQLLHLGAAQCGVDIGQAVVVANLVVDEQPFVRHLGGGGEVLGEFAQLLVVGEDGAAAAGGDDLVAVEAQGRDLAPVACVPALLKGAQ